MSPTASAPTPSVGGGGEGAPFQAWDRSTLERAAGPVRVRSLPGLGHDLQMDDPGGVGTLLVEQFARADRR